MAKTESLKSLASAYRAQTILNAHDLYLTHHRALLSSPWTLAHHANTFKRFQEFLEPTGIENLEDLTAHHFRTFILACRESGRTERTIVGYLRDLRAWCNWIEAEGLLDRSPFRTVKVPRTPKKILPAFTKDEIKALERATHGRDPVAVRTRALVFCLLDSGIRLSECANLKIGDVNLDTGHIFIRQGKGKKDGISRLGQKALAAMTRYARLRGGNPEDALWVGRLGNLTSNGIAQALERIGKESGVHCHAHKFRRSCALTMLRNGATLLDIQHILRHEDLQVVKQYLDIVESDVTRAHKLYSPLDNL